MNMMEGKDDAISRRAARDAMLRLYNEDLERFGVLIPETFDAARAAEAINELPAVRQWIPVTEKLPKQSGKYLVTVKNGNVYAGTFDGYSGAFQCAAIAWMSLPEPYKVGGRNE